MQHGAGGVRAGQRAEQRAEQRVGLCTVRVHGVREEWQGEREGRRRREWREVREEGGEKGETRRQAPATINTNGENAQTRTEHNVQ